MLYPYMGGLIDDILGRDMTAFLVTNGTLPDQLQALLDNNQEPTQLYITLAAATKEMLHKTALPMFDDSWERLQRSLSLLKEFKRSVIRLTMVRHLNFSHPEKYAALIDQAQPDFVEVKSFVNVGGARERLDYTEMLLFPEMQAFAREIERHSNYQIVDEKPDSRVVLLAHDSSSPRSLFYSE